MKREEAIQLLREALGRLERPSTNANGGAIMIGGVYWRLATVLREYVDKELDDHEGATHAAFVRASELPVRPVASLDTVRALVEALDGLLEDTQHATHHCGDPDCPVDAARAALARAKAEGL